MKKMVICFLIIMLSVSNNTQAQATELAQLALNIEKLAQFKQILADLKAGYEILSGGYKTIKDLSEGNFKLHKVFLDGLMEVNPAIKNYKRVADIIDYQLKLVKEYKSAASRFKNSGMLTIKELDYISRVYTNLFNQSLKSLDDLLTVVTANKLRMSDDERVKAIDKVFTDMEDKLVFLRSFNDNTAMLIGQRVKEKREVSGMRSIYGR